MIDRSFMCMHNVFFLMFFSNKKRVHMGDKSQSQSIINYKQELTNRIQFIRIQKPIHIPNFYLKIFTIEYHI